MRFFDWLNDEEQARGVLKPPPPGPMPVDLSGGGSVIPSNLSEKQQRRGKKAKIPVHRVKPLTSLDKAKLEMLSHSVGDPTLEDLQKFGIRYELDPSDITPSTGAGVVREPMAKEAFTPTAPGSNIQLADLPGVVANLPGFNPGKIGAEAKAQADAESEQRAIEAKTRADVLKMQEQARLKEEEPESPEVAAAQRKDIDDNARAIERKRALTGDDGTPGRDNIFEPFNALAPDGKKEFVKQAAKVMRKIQERLPGLDPMSTVSFWVAMPAYAEALGPEVWNRVMGPIAALEKERSNLRKPTAPTQEDVEGKITASEGRIAEIEANIKKFQDIANDSALNTPLGITGFILLSLLLGPNMAAFIFSRSSSRGKTQASLAEAYRMLKREEQTRESMMRMRENVGRSALEGERQAEDRLASAGERRESRALEHRYRMHEMRAEYEARKRLQGGKEDEGAKELLGSLNQQWRIIASAEKEVDRLREEVKHWSAQATSAIDAGMRSQFENRWRGERDKSGKVIRPGAEQLLQAAEERLAKAQEAFEKIAAIYHDRYGTRATQVKPATEAGGE